LDRAAIEEEIGIFLRDAPYDRFAYDRFVASQQ
jgi:hypothetical protein